MKYTKAFSPEHLHSQGVKAQRGQWVGDAHCRGRFVGVTPRGTVWVTWPSRGRGMSYRFKLACKNFDALCNSHNKGGDS